jgi:hypothetical protein
VSETDVLYGEFIEYSMTTELKADPKIIVACSY